MIRNANISRRAAENAALRQDERFNQARAFLAVSTRSELATDDRKLLLLRNPK